jgi:hypothetical protein
VRTKTLLGALLSFIFLAITLPAIAKISYAADSQKSAGFRNIAEEQILHATVRIMVESWLVRQDESGYEIDRTVGHGTVIAGRYLLTHNHFGVPLSILQEQEESGSYAVVYLYNSQGQLLHKGPLTDYEVAHKGMETLVFAHKEAAFFENLGLSSADFAAGPAPELQPGMEVAQVDWDGVTARVDWVRVKEIIVEDGAPRMVLDDSVLPGASGGGIFWNGVHVANNWRLEETIDGTGSVVAAVTTAALNPVGIAMLNG